MADSTPPAPETADSELLRRVFYLQTLHDVTREIAGLQDPNSILKVAAMTLAGAVGSATSIAVIRKASDAPLETAFALGLGPDAVAPLPADLDGEGVRLLDDGSDPLARELIRLRLRVWIGFRLEEGTVAGLGLGSRLSEESYGPEDLRFLETVRFMVRQALHNARLFQLQAETNAALEDANRELEALVQDRTRALSAACEALSGDGSGEFVAESPAMRQVIAQLEQVAATHLTVLLSGETGTGKGVAARLVHQLSPRKSEPFVHVNCGALPANLIESELFGHEKGSFTGAHAARVGKVELAQGGTLFLDEIGDMPHEAQVKLLRLLEERVFERVGGSRATDSTARVIAATNRDLERLVQEGVFREDLYFRLRVFPVSLPPLRQRREDLPVLARNAVETFCRLHLDRPPPEIDPAVLAQMQDYNWPGNVRELEHVMQRAVLRCRQQRVGPGDVDLLPDGDPAPAPVSRFSTLADMEREHIRRALEATDWVVFGPNGAARLLGVNPQTLRYRIKKHGLTKP